MSLSDRLRLLRRRAGLSQAQLAELSTVSQRTIARIEGGWDRPNRSTVRLLAHAFDITVSELRDGANGDGEAAA
jgi:transcriptional regulator with XRE-family HTH domain